MSQQMLKRKRIGTQARWVLKKSKYRPVTTNARFSFTIVIKPDHYSYKQWHRIFHYVLGKNGLSKGYGLRQGYAQMRNQQLQKEYACKNQFLGLSIHPKYFLREVYRVLVEELGLSRLDVLKNYLKDYNQIHPSLYHSHIKTNFSNEIIRRSHE
jgi:hypothetical protein